MLFCTLTSVMYVINKLIAIFNMYRTIRSSRLWRGLSEAIL